MAAGLSTVACIGNICLKVDLKPWRGFEATTSRKAVIKATNKKKVKLVDRETGKQSII